MKNKKTKNERGSITIFVLTGMVFMLIVLMTAYAGINNKLQAQNKKIETIKLQYEGNDIEQEYKEAKEREEKSIVNASDIAGMRDKTYIYGATVTGYTLPSTTSTDVGWKIFYADNKNIYIIADNYVERENLPYSTTAGTKETMTTRRPSDGNSSYARAAKLKNILKDYAGSSRITDNRLKALNNDYFTKGYTSEEDNMKSIAYLMDTVAWGSKFKDTKNKADYVIGGPTVELLLKSYNDKYGTKYESEAIELSDKSNAGYQIRKTSSDTWKNGIEFMLETTDSLYVIAKQSDAYMYWLSSPSVLAETFVMYVDYKGGVYRASLYSTVADYSGFRPLVCLNSDVKLEKVSNTEYKIQQ